MEGSQERVLRDVLSVVPANDPCSNPLHHAAMSLDQKLEPSQVAGEGSPNESLVGGGSSRGGRLHARTFSFLERRGADVSGYSRQQL